MGIDVDHKDGKTLLIECSLAFVWRVSLCSTVGGLKHFWEFSPRKLGKMILKWLETCWNHQFGISEVHFKKVHHFWCEYVVTFLFSDCSFLIELLFFFNGLSVLRPMMVFCFLVGKAPRYLPRLHYALLVLKFCYDWLNVLSSDVALFFVWKALTKALQSVGSNFGPGFKDLFVDFFTPPQKKN